MSDVFIRVKAYQTSDGKYRVKGYCKNSPLDEWVKVEDITTHKENVDKTYGWCFLSPDKRADLFSGKEVEIDTAYELIEEE